MTPGPRGPRLGAAPASPGRPSSFSKGGTSLIKGNRRSSASSPRSRCTPSRSPLASPSSGLTARNRKDWIVVPAIAGDDYRPLNQVGPAVGSATPHRLEFKCEPAVRRYRISSRFPLSGIKEGCPIERQTRFLGRGLFGPRAEGDERRALARRLRSDPGAVGGNSHR
jgi:hypothetical protein